MHTANTDGYTEDDRDINIARHITEQQGLGVARRTDLHHIAIGGGIVPQFQADNRLNWKSVGETFRHQAPPGRIEVRDELELPLTIHAWHHKQRRGGEIRLPLRNLGDTEMITGGTNQVRCEQSIQAITAADDKNNQQTQGSKAADHRQTVHGCIRLYHSLHLFRATT